MKEVTSNTARINEKTFLLAIDGGGTKTSAVLFTPDGNVAAAVNGRATNPNLFTDEQLYTSFLNIFEELGRNRGGIPLSPHMVFAGLSGAYNPVARKRGESIIGKLLPENCALVVSHDAINSLWSSAEGESGIAVIAGTGSIIFGMNCEGKEFRLGGWGHLISDEGSGYDMGRMALKAVMDAYDGIGPGTLLTAMILDMTGCKSPPDIIPLVYKKGKPFVASLSRCILKACQQKDQVAQVILDDACSKLSAMLEAGISRARKTGGWERPYGVVLTGGLWNSRVMTSAFQKKVESFCMDMNVIIPDLPPVYGAARYLMHLAGAKTGDGFFKEFSASFSERNR